MAYGFNEDRSRAPMYTKDEIDDIIETVVDPSQTFNGAQSSIGGDGTLFFNSQLLVEGTTSATNIVWHDKKSNNIGMRFAIANDTGSAINIGTPVLKVPTMQCRYRTSNLWIRVPVMIAVYDTDTTDASRQLKLVKCCSLFAVGEGLNHNQLDLDTCWTEFSLTTSLPNHSVAYFMGSAPSGSMQGWQNSTMSNSVLGNKICSYFLNGGSANWQGEFSQNSNSSHRLDPSYRESNCSGLIFMAYNNYDIHPQGSVTGAYVADGILISFAPAGNLLDLSAARPADIVCFQNPTATTDLYSSWTDCALYAGNNTLYQITELYPTSEHLLNPNIVDAHGPYVIMTPADRYRMNDEPAEGQVLGARNRAVIRFI